MFLRRLWCAPALLTVFAIFPVPVRAQTALVAYGSAGYRYAITSVSFPPVGSTILPYGFSGYRYAITSGSFPTGVELPSFDDSGYAVGTAPFSNGTGPGIYTPATLWPENTKLIARTHFNVPGTPARTTLRFGIDNDVTIYINGVLVATGGGGPANYDDFTVSVPDGVLQTGDNLLVALAADRGGSTAFDVSLTTGVELPSFDDSGYATGTAPFSNGTGPGIYTPATLWPENTTLIARLRFDVPGTPSPTTLRFGIDNDVTIFINGVLVASGTLGGAGCGGCWPADYDDYVIPLPYGVLQPGENLLVALAVDHGGNTAFDVCLTTDGVTPVARTTWGGLKASYR